MNLIADQDRLIAAPQRINHAVHVLWPRRHFPGLGTSNGPTSLRLSSRAISRPGWISGAAQ